MGKKHMNQIVYEVSAMEAHVSSCHRHVPGPPAVLDNLQEVSGEEPGEEAEHHEAYIVQSDFALTGELVLCIFSSRTTYTRDAHLSLR
jgi:hypothetical protein